MKKKLHVLLLAFLCIQSLFIEVKAQLNKSITHNSINRDYTIYVPDSYDGSKVFPLVFCFHGYTSNGLWFYTKTGFGPVADSNDFIAVFPQGTSDNSGNPYWNVFGSKFGNPTDDFGFVEALIDTISENYRVDSSRLYATGFSNGGFFTYALAGRLSERFAAVAPVAGLMYPDTLVPFELKHPTPILIIHGTSDGAVPYTGFTGYPESSTDSIAKYWAYLNNCNPIPTRALFPDISPDDGSIVEHRYYEGGDNGATVDLFRVNRSDHFWPGFLQDPGNQDINAAEEMWRFFSRFKLVGGELISTPREERLYDPLILATEISMPFDTLNLIVGEADRLSATVFPENATYQSLRWESDDNNIIKVYSYGGYQALQVGETKIKVSSTEDPTISKTIVVSVSTQTSVESYSSNSIQYLMYPNPVVLGDPLSIELHENSEVLVSIYDLQGKAIFSKQFSGEKLIVLNTSNLKLGKGMYVVGLKTTQGYSMQKIIVR